MKMDMELLLTTRNQLNGIPNLQNKDILEHNSI